jgi:hypothetical protein
LFADGGVRIQRGGKPAFELVIRRAPFSAPERRAARAETPTSAAVAYADERQLLGPAYEIIDTIADLSPQRIAVSAPARPDFTALELALEAVTQANSMFTVDRRASASFPYKAEGVHCHRRNLAAPFQRLHVDQTVLASEAGLCTTSAFAANERGEPLVHVSRWSNVFGGYLVDTIVDGWLVRLLDVEALAREQMVLANRGLTLFHGKTTDDVRLEVIRQNASQHARVAKHAERWVLVDPKRDVEHVFMLSKPRAGRSGTTTLRRFLMTVPEAEAPAGWPLDEQVQMIACRFAAWQVTIVAREASLSLTT